MRVCRRPLQGFVSRRRPHGCAIEARVRAVTRQTCNCAPMMVDRGMGACRPPSAKVDGRARSRSAPRVCRILVLRGGAGVPRSSGAGRWLAAGGSDGAAPRRNAGRRVATREKPWQPATAVRRSRPRRRRLSVRTRWLPAWRRAPGADRGDGMPRGRLQSARFDDDDGIGGRRAGGARTDRADSSCFSFCERKRN